MKQVMKVDAKHTHTHIHEGDKCVVKMLQRRVLNFFISLFTMTGAHHRAHEEAFWVLARLILTNFIASPTDDAKGIFYGKA